MYPHLRDFMPFSDSIQYGIPKQIKYADSDSSSFNSNESLSDEQSFQNDLSPSYQSKPLIPSSNTNHTPLNPLSNDNSPLTQNENSTFKQTIETHQTYTPFERSRHSSRNQSASKRKVNS